MSVALKVLLLCFAHCVGRVLYHLGAKPPLGSDAASFDRSDCSGFVRWILNRAGYTICDGSQQQLAWFEKEAQAGRVHKLTQYSDVTYAKDDPSRLFIAFESAARTGIGHVWLLHADGKGNMMTIECCGSHGVYTRPWSDLEAICAACYEITPVITE